MRVLREIALLTAVGAIVLPGAALAGAGDDQYIDPLEGLTGTTEKTTTSKVVEPTQQSAGSSSTPTAALAPAVPKAKSNKKAKKTKPSERASFDINGLSGIGALVAVPVRHVTLVVSDIAHERG